LDWFDALAVNIQPRADLGVRVEAFPIGPFDLAAELCVCRPSRLPVDTGTRVRCAVKICRGNPGMRSCADLRGRCFHNDRKQRDAIFLNADERYAVVIAASNTATKLV